jgi:acyl carrier protein
VLIALVAEVLGLPPGRASRSRPLSKMGMDSLMAVELRNRIEREFRIRVPIVTLLNDGSIDAVAQAIAEQLRQPAAGGHPGDPS